MRHRPHAPLTIAMLGLLLLCASHAEEPTPLTGITTTPVPSADESLSSQAHALVDSGSLDEAKAVFTEFTQQFPSSPLAADARYYLGWIAWKQNRLPDAETAWKAVSADYPTSPQAATAHYQVAALHHKTKASRDALVAEYQHVVTDHPSSPEAAQSRLNIGKLWLRRPADFAKSIEALTQLKDSSADPRWRAEAMTSTGLAYLQQYYAQGRKKASDLQTALDTLGAVRTQFPEQGDAVARAEIRLACYYLEVEKDPTKAQGVLEKITSTYPACAHIVEAKYHLATCLRASGDIPGCIARCSDIIAQYPESEWCDYALYYIGNSQYEMGRRDECIATYRQVIQQYPTGQWAAVAKKTLALMGAKDDAGGKQ